MPKLFIFKCATDHELLGCTYDKGAANLPPDTCKGDWKLVSEHEMAPGEDIPAIVGVARQALADDLAAQGYHLSHARIIATRSDVRRGT